MERKKLAVITDDERLFHKIRLLVSDVLETVRESDEASLTVSDLRCRPAPSGSITLGRGGDFQIPPPLAALRARILERLSGEECPRIRLSSDGSLLRFGERTVRLTDTELRLLRALLLADGFVSREQLLHEVFGEGADGGLLNVYVHYLREKLEGDGVRVIISSRKEGYKIDERFKVNA